jgi:hypothetical protein
MYLGTTKLQRLGTVLLLLSAFDVVALSQAVNGAFRGTVTDSSGAVIAGAKITTTNLSQGQVRYTTTDKSGYYAIAQVPPGEYSITVTKPGFDTAIRSHVELLVNEDLQVNYQLNVGAVTQSVEVTGAPPMLRTADATLGLVIGSEQTVDLPLNGRQFTQLILLEPGAAPKEGGQQAYYVIPVGGSAISPSVNGEQPTENTFTLDGILNNHPFYQATAISPPPDAIQEFNAQYHATGAQFGISSGADVNVVTKSGTSKFHGDAWEFLRNSALDAPDYFDDYTHLPKPPYRQNQYGLTIGGPVLLPHYNGREKRTFFFGYWEGFRSSKSFTGLANVPTQGELGGNFSDLLTTTPTGTTDDLGRPILEGQIYNPNSTREVTAGEVDPVTKLMATSSGLVRDPFPGNIIPANMLTPQALTYLKAFYPTANYGPGGDSFPNYAAASAQTITSDQFGVGLDHTFSNNDTLTGNFYYVQPNETLPNSLLLGTNESENHARLLALAYTHMLSSTSVLTFHYGYRWLFSEFSNEPAGLALAQATNLQGMIEEQDNYPLVADISLSPRLSGTSQTATPQGPDKLHQINIDYQKVHGRQTLGIGLLYVHMHVYTNGWGANLAFDQYPSSGISPDDTNQGSDTGDGLASMLLNLPSSFSESAGDTAANITEYWMGGYVQDNLQVTRNLNLTVGLRWDFDSPPHYLHNEFSAWNSNCPTGQADSTAADIYGIEEACIFMPIPYVPLPTASNPTPLTWPISNVRSSIWEPKYNGWQPRFGFAYALKSTVIRGGVVLFDDHNQFFKEVQGARGAWPFALQAEGGPINTNLNRGIPTTYFNDMPSAVSFLTGATPEMSVAEDPNTKIPNSLEYNFGFDHQITPNMALTVNYVGSESRHLWDLYTYNQPLPSEMGPNAFPNGLPFPFLGTTLAGEGNFFIGNYNGLEAKLQKRFSQGLSLLASYTYSKCLDENSGDYGASPQNTYNVHGDYGPCDYNFPELFSFAGTYQLPFGRGRQFGGNLGRPANALIGGWDVSDITEVQSGSPFTATISGDNANTGTSQRPNVVPACQLRPPGFKQTVSAWYNTACFVVAPVYTFGDAERNSMRGPGYVDTDISLKKNFNLPESKVLQFRADSFNALNNVNLAPPGGSGSGSYANLGGSTGTSVNSSEFMKITSSGPSREFQFAVKLLF